MSIDEETISRLHGPITSELCVRLATLLNDFNPAHYDLTFATEVGLPGVIAPGTLLQGWILADLAAEIGQDRAAPVPHPILSIDLRFRSPVLVNEHVLMTYAWKDDHVDVVVTASADPGGKGRTVATGSVIIGRAGAAHA